MKIYINQLKDSLEDRLIYFKLAIKAIDNEKEINKILLSYIEAILKKIEDEKDNIQDIEGLDEEEPIVSESISNILTSLYQSFSVITFIINVIKLNEQFASGSPFIEYIKNYFSEIFKNTEIIFLPHSNFNYSIFSLSEWIKGFNYIEKYEKEIIVTYIPQIEKDNILNHVLCAHEIGHRIYDKNKIYDAYILKINKADFDKIVEEKIDDHFNKINKPKPLFAKTTFIKIWQRWLEELFCDAIGLSLFGPAYFFAEVNFIPAISLLTSYSNDHPPLWLRLYMLTRYMSKDSYLKYVQHFTNEYTRETYNFWYKKSIDLQKKAVRSENLIKIEDYLFFIFTDDYLDKIYQVCFEELDTKIFKLEDTKQIDRYSKYIENNVPPVDCEGDSDDNISPMVYIMNAGWNVYKTSFSNYLKNCVDESDENYLAKGKINLIEIISKSLGLSLTKKLWNEYKKNINK